MKESTIILTPNMFTVEGWKKFAQEAGFTASETYEVQIDLDTNHIGGDIIIKGQDNNGDHEIDVETYEKDIIMKISREERACIDEIQYYAEESGVIITKEQIIELGAEAYEYYLDYNDITISDAAYYIWNKHEDEFGYDEED